MSLFKNRIQLFNSRIVPGAIVAILYAVAVGLTSCDPGGTIEIVANIYDYNDRLLAHYEYNEKDQLVRREFTDPKTGASSDFIFHYQNDLVSVVEYIDHQTPENSHEKHYFYTGDDRIDKIETHVAGVVASTFFLDYSNRGLVESIHSTDREPSTFYTYDSRHNVIKTTKHITNKAGEEYVREYEFTYDTKNKANFGLEYLIGVELLPKRGTTSNWEQSLSQNNLLSEGYAGVKHVEYAIEYDRNDYPKTITTKWRDIKTQNPMTLKIEYRKK